MEQLLLEFGLKDGVFAGITIWLLVYTLKTSSNREDKLYTFLDDMKVQFAKLVGNYESLSRDVTDIKEELHKKQDKDQGEW
jgi:hypothetical protein